MSLPINAIFSQLQQSLLENERVILKAPTGAGKSTLLPLLLLKSGVYHNQHKIILLEPRRIAAKQIAFYLAKQLGEEIGQSVGLIMRGENKTSAETIIQVITDGVLVRKIQQDPELTGIGLIIFDEFHERSLQTDLALALALDAQQLAEQVKLLIMSATLDLQSLSEVLSAPVVSSEGRQYPVEVRYLPSAPIPSLQDIESAIANAIANTSGSILVFLTGVGQINRLVDSFKDNNWQIEVLPLHGQLTLKQQQQAILPSENRKLVLATNIAQTSLTIEGIECVVDVGLEKVVVFNHKLAREQLVTQVIAKSSAQQRAGRAGRLAPGVCYRLGSKEHFERRYDFDIAEIERVDIAPLLLEVGIWGAQFDDLCWLTKPKSEQTQRAISRLKQLGFYNEQNQLTQLANDFQRFNAGLTATKLLILGQQLTKETQDQQWLNTACLLASVLDLNVALPQGQLADALLRLSTMHREQLLKQAKQYAKKVQLTSISLNWLEDKMAVLLSLSMPSNIAQAQKKQWKLASGQGCQFTNDHKGVDSQYLLCSHLSVSERGLYIQNYLPLNAELIEKWCDELVSSHSGFQWSQNQGKPMLLEQQRIGELVISQQLSNAPITNEQWPQLWIDYLQQQPQTLKFDDKFEQLAARVILAARYNEQDWPDLDKGKLIDSLDTWLAPYLNDIRTLKQLQQLNVSQILFDSLPWQQQQLLNELCPLSIITPAGNKHRIDYLASQPKFSCKLQEMFGEPTSPTICNGQLALVIELLSPAKRPLQVTQDLAAFWQNGYVHVKKEMKGRYPKHPWPDNPVEFVATSKTKAQLNR